MIVKSLYPLGYSLGNRSEPAIGVRATACWISFMIVLVSVFRDEAISFCLYFCFCACAIPHEKPISASYHFIARVIYSDTIYEVVYILTPCRRVHMPKGFDEIFLSQCPVEIHEEIAPRRSCHMDMHQSSLTVMEMDTILWMDIGRHIAPRSLFHIVFAREVFSFPIDIHREVRMIVYLVWTWYEYIGESTRESDNYKKEEEFFHVWRIEIFEYFSSLYPEFLYEFSLCM